MSLFDKEPALFAEVARKVNATSAWEMFDKPLLSHQVAQATQIPEGDWTENWFTKGNHKYQYLSRTVCAVSECKFEDVVDALNKVGVHPKQSIPFVPGKPYRADVNLPGPWGEDHITSVAIYDLEGQQIGVRNTTEMNHKLHPGVAERKVVELDGFYHILTEGGGSGVMGGPNIWLDELLWQFIDDPVIDYLKKSSD